MNTRNRDGNTPLHQLLLLSGDRDRIVDLLRAGARTDIANSVGQTARQMAEVCNVLQYQFFAL